MDLPGSGQSSGPLGTGMRPCHAFAQLRSHVCSHTGKKLGLVLSDDLRLSEELLLTDRG